MVVCDWGLADIEATKCDESLLEYCSILEYDLNNQTLDGTIKGSPGYMAPEQTSMVKIRKGRHTDVFSLGTLLYSLLTLEKPFTGDSFENILNNTAKCNFLKPSKLQPNVPLSLEAVCLKAMQLKPEERYHSVKDLQKDIEAYRHGFATYAENASFFKLLKLLIYRQKMLFSLACSLFLLIFVLALVFIRNLELSKKNTEQVNEKLMLEQEIHLQRGKDSAPLFLERAQESLKVFDIETSLRFCNQALERDDEMIEAWDLKGYLLFIKEDFENSIKAYQKAGKHEGKIVSLAKDSLSLGKALNNDEKLKRRIDLLGRLHKQNDMQTFSFLRSSILLNDMTLDERLVLCKYIINLRNKRQKNVPFNFHYDPQTRTLDISNNPWIRYAYCLRHFPADTINASNTSISHGGNFLNKYVKRLDISHTLILELKRLRCKNLQSLNISGNIIHDLSPLKNYSLVSLDISHTPIRYLNFVLKMPTLKRLYIHKNQFKKVQYRRLPKDLDIIVK